MTATATEPKLSKRPGRPPARLIDPLLTFDPGPSWKQKTDGTLLSRGPGAAVLEDREDLAAEGDSRGAKPIIRGARRKPCSIDLLFTAGAITRQQYFAAMQFLDDCSLAAIGGGTANLTGVPASPPSYRGIPLAKLNARTRCREVEHLLGLNDGTVFSRVLFKNMSLNDCDAEDKVQHGTSGRLLKLALTALDEWYNGKNRRPE